MDWKIGNVTITRVVESLPVLASTDMFGEATAEALARHTSWLVPHFMGGTDTFYMSIHSFVVRSNGTTVLVDTCVGNDKERSFPGMSGLRSPYLEHLVEAGCAPESVDVVLCTHLHLDHVGWNTRLEDGRWVPTFPNARYLFSRTEWEHWHDRDGSDAAEVLDFRKVLADSVQPIFDAGLVELVDGDHRLTEEMALEPTPGHTPGHVSVRITSGGEEAVITGDAFHHPCQIGEPTWSSGADSDSVMASATRQKFVDRYGDTEVLVLGTHFPPPTAGRITKGPHGYWFDTAQR